MVIEHYWMTCLVVCPLVFLGSFVDSIAGGGGLISIPAYLFAGIPPHLTAGTNKVVNGIGTATAVWRYARGGKVDFRAAAWAAAGALMGAPMGAQLALWFSEAVLQAFMLGALPLIAVVLSVKRDFGDTAVETHWTPWQKHLLSVVIGIATGMYDGLFGPGTGTFLMMAFTLVLGMDLLEATGCAKVANLAANTGSAVVFISAGKVVWQLVPVAVIFSILGNQAGAAYALRGGSKKIRGVVFVVLGLLFVKVFWELIT